MGMSKRDFLVFTTRFINAISRLILWFFTFFYLFSILIFLVSESSPSVPLYFIFLSTHTVGIINLTLSTWTLFLVVRLLYRLSSKGVAKKNSFILRRIGYRNYYDFMTFCVNAGLLITISIMTNVIITNPASVNLIPLIITSFGLLLTFVPSFDIDYYDKAIIYLEKFRFEHDIRHLIKAFEALNDIYPENLDRNVFNSVVNTIYSKSYLRKNLYDSEIQQLVNFLKLKNPTITHDETINFLNTINPDLHVESLFLRSSAYELVHDFIYKYWAQITSISIALASLALTLLKLK